MKFRHCAKSGLDGVGTASSMFRLVIWRTVGCAYELVKFGVVEVIGSQ